MGISELSSRINYSLRKLNEKNSMSRYECEGISGENMISKRVVALLAKGRGGGLQ